MPELPEVETVCRQLAPALVGLRLLSVIQHDSKLGFGSSARSVRGKRVRAVFRSGKQIIVELKGDERTVYVAVHLRMTGRLLWKASRQRPLRAGRFVHNEGTSDRSRLDFEFDGGVLSFCDVRRFGTVKLYREAAAFRPKGIDPILDDFAFEKFAELLRQSTQPLKHLLMRQDRFVGIGNIYASEILFDSKLSPLRSANTLSLTEQKSLQRSIVKILRKAIARSGTTFSDYADSAGNSGRFQTLLKVYEREGQKCGRCKKTVIQRIVQQQRSTYFCPTCQR